MIPDDELEARVRRDARALAERPLPDDLRGRILSATTRQARTRPRMQWQVAVAGVTAAALAAAALVVGVVLHNRAPASTPASHPAWHQVFRVPVNGGPNAALGAGAGSAWVSARSHTQLFRIDSATGTSTLVARPTELQSGVSPTLPGRRSSALVTPQGIWVATDNKLLRIDPVSGAAVTTLPIASVGPDHGVIADSTGIWAASGNSQAVFRIDPSNFSIVATIPLLSQVPAQSADVSGDPDSVASLGGLVWAAGNDSESVAGIDPATNAVVRTIRLAHSEGDMVAAAGSLWIASPSAGVVDRMDPATGDVIASIAVADPVSLAPSSEGVWVASGPGEVVRIDTGTNAIADRVAITGPAFAVAADGDDVWAGGGQDAGISLIRQG